jgi:DNA-directed RNA polymerase subunit RPC12/RpoP
LKNIGGETMEYKCVFCGKIFNDKGYDPFPIKKEGRCCAWCSGVELMPEIINYKTYKDDVIWALKREYIKSDDYQVTKEDIKDVCRKMEIMNYFDDILIQAVMDYFDKEKITDNMSDILDREYEKYQI